MSSTEHLDNSDRETFLLGDTREELLKAVKRHIDFKNLAEKNQRALVADVEQVARQMVRRVANVVHGHGHLSTPIRWGEFKIKAGNVEPKAVVPVVSGVVDGFLEHNAGVLIFVDPDVFMGERGASEIFPDQPDLMEQAKPADDERPIAEVNAERLRKGIKPLPVEEEDAVQASVEQEASVGEVLDAIETAEGGYDLIDAEEAPPTQPADEDLVEQREEEGAAEPEQPARIVQRNKPISSAVEAAQPLDTPPSGQAHKPGSRRPPRAPRARDVPTGE